MRFRTWGAQAAMLAAMTFPACAAAQQALAPTVTLNHMTLGYSYFNRSGADLNLHDAEVAACVTEAARTISPQEMAGPPPGLGVVTLVLVEGPLLAWDHRGAVAAALENCMVVRGWRVVKLPDDEGEALARLKRADLRDRMAPWVGAAQPHGLIVRVWNNDAADVATHRLRGGPPSHTEDGQLSLIEATGRTLDQFNEVIARTDTKPGANRVQKVLEPQLLSSAPPGVAIILVQLKGVGMNKGFGLNFIREASGNDRDPSSPDPANDFFGALQLPSAWHKGDHMLAFAVPPGRWRVSGLAEFVFLDLCLGSPSFDAAAGDVVYAGSFDFSAADIGPDLDVAPAKAWLEGRPQAAAVRPAVYTNGSRGACGGNMIYALEVKGALFEPGYAWGSATSSPPTSAPKAP